MIDGCGPGILDGVTSDAATVPTAPANLRDLATSTARVRPGVLLRSDAPRAGDVVTAHGLEAWPPPTVLDLRSPGEMREEHPYAGSARVVNVPILEGIWPERIPPTLHELYQVMLTAPSAPLLVRAVTEIADADGPVLVHCSAGKDRTGLTVAIACHLIGVAREEILHDYERSAAVMHLVLARMYTTMRKVHDIPPGFDSAAGEALTAVLDALDAHEGGPIGWLTRHGGDASLVDRLRVRLLHG